jgi:hypothetical protein
MTLNTRIVLAMLIVSVAPAFALSQAVPLFEQTPMQSQAVAEGTVSPAPAASPTPGVAIPPNPSVSVKSQPVTVPARTHVMMALKSPLNSTSGTSGSAIYLETLYPVVQENQVVIPAHTLVEGSVTANKRPGHFNRVSELTFQFKTMILPNNSVVSIDGALQSIPGSGELRAQVKDRKLKPVDQTEAVIKPTVTGSLIGGVIGSATRFGIGKFVGAGLGAGVGLGIVLLARGDAIQLPQGTNLEMVLRAPVQLSREQVEFNAKYVSPNASH